MGIIRKRRENMRNTRIVGMILALMLVSVSAIGICTIWALQPAQAAWENQFGHTPVQITQLFQESGYIWFQLSESDYTLTSNIKLKTDGYAEKLDALNTFDKIFIEEKPLSDTFSTFFGRDPYFNLFGKIPTSFAFSIGNDPEKPYIVKVEKGCEFPSKAYMEGASELIYTATNTVTFTVSGDGPWQAEMQYTEQDIFSQVDVPYRTEDWADGERFRFKFPQLFSDGGDYTINYKNGYLLDFITIGGMTIREINAATSGIEYEYTTFPGTADKKYATAVYAYLANTSTYTYLDIHIHKDYFETLGDFFSIGLKSGFYLTRGDVKNLILRDRTFSSVYGMFIETEKLGGEKTINAAVDAEKSEILVDGSVSLRAGLTDVSLTALGYLPNEYDVSSIFSRVKINGVSLSEINAENTDGYDWSVCHPFNLGGAYEKPVNVYFNENYLDIRLHPRYLEQKIGDAAITLELCAGFEVLNPEDGTVYRLNATVSGVAVSDRYQLLLEFGEGQSDARKVEAGQTLDLEETAVLRRHYDFVGWKDQSGQPPTAVMPAFDYTLFAEFRPTEYEVAFVNGQEIVAVRIYTVENTEIVEPELPAAPLHYEAYWDKYLLNGGDQTVSVQFRPVRYSVIFKADGVQVGDTLSYTVEDRSVELPEIPEKEGFRPCGWEIFELNGGDVTVNAVYEEIVAETGAEGGGCQTTIAAGSLFSLLLCVLAVVAVRWKNPTDNGVNL